jgi:conjugative transfer signal peptidase TraF
MLLDRGLCPGAYGLLMKRVAAAKGDRVRISAAGIAVNGSLLPDSAPLPFDADGQPLPRADFDRTLADSELLVVGDASVVSFDGRYFGPIDRAQIQAVIEPVFTW